MAQFWAALKTIKDIINGITMIITLINEFHRKNLEKERQQRNDTSNQTAKDMEDEISKPIEDQDADKLRDMLRKANGLPTSEEDPSLKVENKPKKVWGRRS